MRGMVNGCWLMVVGVSLVILLGCTSSMSAQDEGLLSRLDIDVHGFVDVRGGMRTQEDLNEKDASLGEARLQLDLQRMGDLSTIQVRADFLHDEVALEDDLDIEEGTGFIDLREANVLISPVDFMDVKIGRQILTWGTGDLLFINDLFPKDWQSFFSGRDVEYLKAPSDAFFISLFPGAVSIDVAYTPRFDSDRYISGHRISYWNPGLGERAGRDAIVDPVKPDDWFEDDEVAVRAYGNIAGYELAVYLYDGYWKNPEGMDPAAMKPIFPELAVYGASIRGGLGKGLVNFECGYYDSKDDFDGTDLYIPNDEIRALVGYERELLKELSMGVQYYVEQMQDYTSYKSVLLEGQNAKDEDRQVVTLRLTKQAMSQNMVISLFTYYSPTDSDGYVRPVVKYKVNDAWLVTAGGNVFFGEDDYTFFGQFKRNNNVYGGVRYSF